MNEADRTRVETFITRWAGSSGNERANYQLFFAEMCDALGVDRPFNRGKTGRNNEQKGNGKAGDKYLFARDGKSVCAGDRLYAQSQQQTALFVNLRYWRSF